MPFDDSMDSQAFIRQRRNLIVTSLFLTFALATGLTFKNFNLLGANGQLAETVSPAPYLWAALTYFAMRYWQAFEGLTRQSTPARYSELKKKYVQSLGKKKVAAQFSEQGVKFSSVAGRLGKSDPEAWMPADEETLTPTGATLVMMANIVDANEKKQRQVPIDLSNRELRFCRARAVLALVFASNEISEYYLPYLIALIPVGVFARQAIHRCGL
jgi:hypothetical protein